MRKKPDESPYYTVQEFADRLGVSVNAVYFWVSQGYVEAKRFGPGRRPRIRIPKSEAERIKQTLQQ